MLKIILATCINIAVAFSSDNIKILAEDLPPFSYSDSNRDITGIAVEIVKELSSKFNHSGNIDLSSWNRAYNLVKNNDGYVLFPMSRNAKRENLFKWVGPLFNSTAYLYKLKSSDLNKNSFESAKKV